MTVPRAWVLLHGTPLDPAVWTELSPILAERQPVFTPSVTPEVGDRNPQRNVAARLVGRLRESAASWDVVGHSYGGQVAIELALLAPANVATLTIICSRDTPFPPFAQAAANLRRGESIDVDAALSRWFRPAELEADSWLVAYARNRLEQVDRTTWAIALDGIASYDRSGRIQSIEAPGTVICAELDAVSDPVSMKALSDRFRRTQFHLLPGAAHCSPLLDPAALAVSLMG